MRASVRSAIVAFVLLSIVLFTRHFRDVPSTWDGGTSAHLEYGDSKFHHSLVPGVAPSDIATSTDASQEPLTISSFAVSSTSHDDGLRPTATPGSKVIVMPKLESEDTGWVAVNLPEYASGSQIHMRHSY